MEYSVLFSFLCLFLAGMAQADDCSRVANRGLWLGFGPSTSLHYPGKEVTLNESLPVEQRFRYGIADSDPTKKFALYSNAKGQSKVAVLSNAEGKVTSVTLKQEFGFGGKSTQGLLLDENCKITSAYLSDHNYDTGPLTFPEACNQEKMISKLAEFRKCSKAGPPQKDFGALLAKEQREYMEKSHETTKLIMIYEFCQLYKDDISPQVTAPSLPKDAVRDYQPSLPR